MFGFKNKIIKDLKEHIEILDQRYAYLRENFELELDKRINIHQKEFYPQLVKELEYWKDNAEQLQRIINKIGDLKNA